MKKYLIISLALIVTFASFTFNSNVDAQDGDGAPPENEEFAPGYQDRFKRGTGWRQDKFKEELGLTDEQIQKLSDARTAHQKEMVQLQAQLKVAMIDMGQLMKGRDNDAAVIEKSREITAIRTKLAEAQLNHKLHQRSIFTAEQWEKVSKFTRMRGKAMRSNMGRGGRFSSGRSHGRQSMGRQFDRPGRGIGRQFPPEPGIE